MKFSELIRHLEDGGQIRRVIGEKSYNWFGIDRLPESVITIHNNTEEYETRSAANRICGWMNVYGSDVSTVGYSGQIIYTTREEAVNIKSAGCVGQIYIDQDIYRGEES